MSKIRYSKEPVDTKLLILYILKEFRFIVYGVLSVACLFGGIYHLERNVWSDPTPYTAESVIYMTYADDVRESNVYINNASWPVLIKSDLYIDTCMDKLNEQGVDITRDELMNMVEANIETDLRMVIVKASSLDLQRAVMVNNAMTETISALSEQTKDIEKAEIITLATDASKVEFSDRTYVLAISGGIVGLIISVIGLTIAFCLDDSIYLPGQFEYRYDIPVLGIALSKDRKSSQDDEDIQFGTAGRKRIDWNKRYLMENYRHILASATCVATTDLSLSTDTAYVSKMLDNTVRALAAEERRKLDIGELKTEEALYSRDDYRLVNMPALNENADIVGDLRQYDAVILLVQAGDHNGAIIERSVAYLEKQDVKVKGAILYDADAVMLMAYTFSPFSRSLKLHKRKEQDK